MRVDVVAAAAPYPTDTLSQWAMSLVEGVSVHGERREQHGHAVMEPGDDARGGTSAAVRVEMSVHGMVVGD